MTTSPLTVAGPLSPLWVSRHRRSRVCWAALACLTAAVLATSGCALSGTSQDRALWASTPEADTTVAPAPPTPPPTPITAVLTDDIRRLPGEQITWNTTWRMCWQPEAGAVAYELQTLTGEGTVQQLTRQQDTCYALQVAAGENPVAEGLRDRDLQLALQSGQLGYRVRTVYPGGDVGQWSQPIPVGANTATARGTTRIPPSAAPATHSSAAG